jgi:hypothetical protein
MSSESSLPAKLTVVKRRSRSDMVRRRGYQSVNRLSPTWRSRRNDCDVAGPEIPDFNINLDDFVDYVASVEMSA